MGNSLIDIGKESQSAVVTLDTGRGDQLLVK